VGYDLSILNRGLRQQGLPQADGLLGVDSLAYFAAVIDYSSRQPRLFLIDPYVQDVKLLNGKWVGEAADVAGKAGLVADGKKMRLAIKEGMVDLRLWDGRQLRLEMGLMYLGSEVKWIDLSSTEANDRRMYPCIYEVSREWLRLCIPLDPRRGETPERPLEFRSRPDGPTAVLTFRRVDKEEKQK
jgi:hypothetical protein